MVFTSHIFIFYFLPITLLVYYLLPYSRRNFFLLIASYIFYGWFVPWYLLLMLAATVINYICGYYIAKYERGDKRRFYALLASVVLSVGLLGFFKYFMFFESNLNSLLELFGASSPLPVLKVLLPAGISFYIFHNLSYTVDIYRGVAKPVRTFFDFACFIALFPQLIAGPILRYNTIADQLINRTHTLDKFTSGVALFILGFAKKILIANMIGKVADAVFATQSPAALDAWFGVIAYALQIYFDFSAYSDMAIGIGRMLGFEFMKNFNAPYLVDSITDFWRRWHISLSTWLRDYLYVPLGGNRKGPRRTYINLAMVMLLGGLWHGANWTFVVWGAYHGTLLAFERWRGKTSIYDRFPRPVRVAITFVLVLFSWVLFRSDNFTDAFQYFSTMFGQNPASSSSTLLSAEIYTQGTLITMALCGVLIVRPVQAYDWAQRITWPKLIFLVVLFCVSLMTMFVQSFNPFLYFQF